SPDFRHAHGFSIPIFPTALSDELPGPAPASSARASGPAANGPANEPQLSPCLPFFGPSVLCAQPDPCSSRAIWLARHDLSGQQDMTIEIKSTQEPFNS